MIKAIFVDLLIVVAIMFIYPLESIIMPIGMSIFSNSSSDKDLIKGFGNVRIENYKKYEKIESDDVYVDCYAIYFNEKQSNAIESQINSDENWTREPFNEKIINKYKKEYPLYNLRHNVKAGMTSLSHVYGNYYTEPKYRYLYDLYYISNYSLLLDIKIIFKTLFVILHLK